MPNVATPNARELYRVESREARNRHRSAMARAQDEYNAWLETVQGVEWRKARQQAFTVSRRLSGEGRSRRIMGPRPPRPPKVRPPCARCEKPAKTKGMCNAHYRQQKRIDDKLARQQPRYEQMDFHTRLTRSLCQRNRSPK